MAELGQGRRRDRIAALAGVAALHALLGYAFVTGLAVDVASRVTENLKMFDVIMVPPPPPIEERPEERPAPRDEGEAAPPDLRADPVPVVAPPQQVRLPVPPPVTAAPVAGQGAEASAGAASVPGPGTGAGGEGTGLGAGGQGSGTGGGGGAARAQRISGQLVNDDYPRAALRARAEGVVTVRYTVGTDGRVGGCTVTRSSGHDVLDATTCRLIERRFRYRPARDAQGRPTTETVTRTYEWLVPDRAGG